MINRNVQLKLKDIWKNKQSPSISSLSSSSASLNTISEVTYKHKGSGQGDDVQEKGSGQGDPCQGDDVQRRGDKEVQAGELSKDNGQNKDLIQLEREEPIHDDKQEKDHIVFDDNEQNEILIQLDGGESENQTNTTSVCEELYNNRSDSPHHDDYSLSSKNNNRKYHLSFLNAEKIT